MNKFVNEKNFSFIVRFINYSKTIELSPYILTAKDIDDNNYIDFQSIAPLVDIWCTQFGSGSIMAGIINSLPQIRLKSKPSSYIYKFPRDKPHYEDVLYKYGVCSSKLYKNEYALLKIKNNNINLNNNYDYKIKNYYKTNYEKVHDIENYFDKI